MKLGGSVFPPQDGFECGIAETRISRALNYSVGSVAVRLYRKLNDALPSYVVLLQSGRIFRANSELGVGLLINLIHFVNLLADFICVERSEIV